MSEPGETARLLESLIPIFAQHADALRRTTTIPPLTPPASPHAARASLSSASSAAAQALDELEARLAAVSSQLDVATRAVSHANRALAQLQRDREQCFDQRIAAHQASDEAEMDKLRKSERSMAGLIREKQSEILALEQRVVDLEREKAQLRTAVLAAETTQLHEALRLSDEARASAEAAHQEEVEGLQRDAAARVDAEQKKLAELEARLQGVLAEVAAHIVTVAERDTQLQERQEMCASLEEKVQKLETDLGRLSEPDKHDWQLRRKQGSRVTTITTAFQFIRVILKQRGS